MIAVACADCSTPERVVEHDDHLCPRHRPFDEELARLGAADAFRSDDQSHFGGKAGRARRAQRGLTGSNGGHGT
jgi:hypothetical protein